MEILLVGDKNAILIASRILGYGKDYEFEYGGEKQVVDLSLLEPKELDESVFKSGENNLYFTTPTTNLYLTFKLLTHADEQAIDQEVKGLKN
jgi:hypothetical protein